MSEFSVKFRGVRGSFPTAGRDFIKYGGNTSCVELNIGERTIILDAGTGIIKSGDDLTEKYICSAQKPEKRIPIQTLILISHIHQDHILGLTFFKPLHISSSNIKIMGAGKELGNDLNDLIFGKTFPLDLGDIACTLQIGNLGEFGEFSINKKWEIEPYQHDKKLKKDDILISYYKSYVHPQQGVMIYKITYQNKSVVYATDKECYLGGDKKFVEFCKNCDLLIHDSQYTTEDYLNPISPKQGFGHSTFDMAIEIMKQSNAKKLAFFHYDPSYNDDKLDKISEYYNADYKNIIFSKENLEIEI